MDNNYRSFAGERNQAYTGLNLEPENPTQYNDICKLSDTQGNVYKDFSFVGGSEDCIDLNRNSCNNLFEGGILHPNGKFVMTVKGHSCNNIWRNITVIGHGTEMDFDFGNDSEQVMRWSTGNLIENVRSNDDKPIRVRVGWASKPKVVNSNVEFLFWQGIGLKFYVVYMWALRKLGAK